MERTITVRGVGNISAKPDFIVIEMHIMGQSKNYSEALADASSAVEAVQMPPFRRAFKDAQNHKLWCFIRV
ncbi:MAG: SIMPL domain-containing protein [Christensenellaceae bacterium]